MVTENLPLDQVIWGNCLQVLSSIPGKSVDLIFADPPYNLQLSRKLWRPNSTKVNGVDEAWDRFSGFESYDQFTYAWLKECRRVLSDCGTIWVIGTYHNIYRVGKILQDLDFWILNDIVWIKNNPMPNFHGVRFTNAHETLIWAQKIKGEKYTFNYHAMKLLNKKEQANNGLQMRSDWKLPLCTGKERIKNNGSRAHPTQKPEALLARVILSSSNPGDIVLDPFFGSGTTGAVSKKLGRHWIGIEAEKAYVSIAKIRIESVKPDLDVIQTYHREKAPSGKRIPFRTLIKDNLIQAGSALYFGRVSDLKAVVLPSGRLQFGELTGSIHEIGSAILKGPCNGWMAWYYINHETGKREPVDILRQKARSMIARQESSEDHGDDQCKKR